MQTGGCAIKQIFGTWEAGGEFVTATESVLLSKKLSCGLLALLVVYAVVRSVFAAAGKPFWYDELLTLVVTSQGSWKGILAALHAPVDGQPPLFYGLERLTSGLPGPAELTLRWPSILALPCTVLCTFVFVRTRRGELVALVCALLVMLSTLAQLYAIEARPYSLVVACFAVAMVCYQRAERWWWALALGLSLALAQSLHYLAVLTMIPFGLAELAAVCKGRRWRWPVWAALAFGGVPLVLERGLIVANQAYYGSHFWARFQWAFIAHTYGEFFDVPSTIGAGIIAVVFVGVIGTWLWKYGVETRDSEDVTEVVLGLALAALPFIGHGLTSALHVGFTPRYVLSAVLGLVIVFGLILSRATRGAVLIFGLFVVAAVSEDEVHLWRRVQQSQREVEAYGTTVAKSIRDTGFTDLPVVVSNGFEYIKLTHYVPPSIAPRFIYLKRGLAPNDENATDTLEKGIVLLEKYLPMTVAAPSEFLPTNHEFLLYVTADDLGTDWMLRQLFKDGWSVRVLKMDEKRSVWLVTQQ